MKHGGGRTLDQHQPCTLYNPLTSSTDFTTHLFTNQTTPPPYTTQSHPSIPIQEKPPHHVSQPNPPTPS